MGTATRRQREIEARERLILDAARRLFNEGGYLHLNMDRIAEAVEYSKGTVYQHFSSKEDLIGALAVETLSLRADMFARAAAFRGRPRERCCAVGVADRLIARLYPDHNSTEQVLDISSIQDKLTPQRLQQVLEIKNRQMTTLHRIVDDAIAAGDLALPEAMPRCTPLYGLWTMAVGHSAMMACNMGQTTPMLGGVDLHAALWQNYQVLMDGYGWKPLSTEWDYGETVERIRREVFPAEVAQIARFRGLANA